MYDTFTFDEIFMEANVIILEIFVVNIIVFIFGY